MKNIYNKLMTLTVTLSVVLGKHDFAKIHANPKNKNTLVDSTRFNNIRLDNLHDDQLELIFSFLDTKDFVQFSRTSRANRNLFTNNDNSIGKRHREDSRYSITGIDGKVYYIEEFLSQYKRVQISRVNNIDLLVRERPDLFKKLVLTAVPHTRKTIEKNLETFYQETMQIKKIVEDLPQYRSAQEKLAEFIVAVLIWSQINDQVWTQVSYQVNYHARQQVGALVDAHLSSPILEHLMAQIRTQVGTQFIDKIKDQVWNHVWNQVNYHVWDQVTDDLADLEYISTLNATQNRKLFNLSIEYNLMIYQLICISMTHTAEFRQIIENQGSGFIHYIQNHISEEQAHNVLENIDIPEDPKVNYLVKTQLEMLQRHLPNQL